MLRRPLCKWAAATLVSAAALNILSALAADASHIQPPTALITHQSRSPTAADMPSFHAALSIDGHYFAMSDNGAGDVQAYRTFANPVLPAADPSNPLEQRTQAIPRGDTRLLTFPPEAGRFSMGWQHGAGMGAKLRLDDSAAHPTVELASGGIRKIKLAFSLHW